MIIFIFYNYYVYLALTPVYVPLCICQFVHVTFHGFLDIFVLNFMLSIKCSLVCLGKCENVCYICMWTWGYAQDQVSVRGGQAHCLSLVPFTLPFKTGSFTKRSLIGDGWWLLGIFQSLPLPLSASYSYAAPHMAIYTGAGDLNSELCPSLEGNLVTAAALLQWSWWKKQMQF